MTGLLPLWGGVLVGAAAAAYIIEDTLRRLLMATHRFWSLAAVDGTSLVLALAVLVAGATQGELTLTTFVVALLVGQTGAAWVAWFRLSTSERPRGPWRTPALRTVLAFGMWRAAAQIIRPTLLTAVRVLVVALVGAAAFGPLEAARVLTAPTLVLVAGLGSFLLPRFVALRARPVRETLQSADRYAAGLAAGVAGVGALACVLLPWLGPLLVGGRYEVPLAAVAGWSAYAAAAAVLLPYSALATVHHRHRLVLAFRGLEFVGLAAALLLVLGVGGGHIWAPAALAIGPLLAALAVRRVVLLPLTRVPTAATVAAGGVRVGSS
ncbi:oligosaccharide flippase family protein [Blastococcus saxobsidens]|nr:oligosaccharide flippase family protein [Blastococcus saxobsidens]